MSINLYNKYTRILIELSKIFLSISLNSKIPTYDELSAKYNVGRGTIKKAINYLMLIEAITLKMRGSSGTFIISKNVDSLIKVLNIDDLLGVMPLPYSTIYEGLATGLMYSFINKNDIKINLSFMRNAIYRIDELLSGRYDFAVVSRHSAETALINGKNIPIVKDFGPGSYMSYHVLITRRTDINEIRDSLKIGFAKSAITQNQITEELCEGYNVEFVESEYSEMIPNIVNGKTDAAVWNRDEVSEALSNIRMIPVKKEQSESNAVLIINGEKEYLFEILNKLIDVEYVVDIQNKVINGDLLPHY